MKLVAALAISAVVLAAQSPRAALHSVTAVRHWTLREATRVAIEVSGDFHFKTDRLHNPERVYFDIVDARPRIGARRFYAESFDDKLVTKVRVAETTPGTTRIVFDLTSPSIEASTSQLSNPNRLIVELRIAGGAPPPTLVATASAPPQVEPPVVLPTAPVPAPPSARTPALPIEPLTLKRPSPPARSAPVETAVAAKRTARPDPLAVDIATARRVPAPAIEPPPTPRRTTKTDTLPVETAAAARRTTTGTTSLIRTLGLKLGKVVIDPGHGGHDQGTEGSKGLLEKDLVLDVSKRVGRLIEERMNAEVVYTRTDDTFIPLEGRTAIANENKADLFLSIHANSSPARGIAGVETYYRSFTTAKDALDVAARENASSQKSIAELEDVIHTMMLGEKVGESKEFAGFVQSSLFSFSARNFPGARDRGVKKAPFVVLNGAKAPSVLVEIGFLSNTREEALLRRPEYRQKLAEALYRGLARYAEGLSHFQVAKAGAE